MNIFESLPHGALVHMPLTLGILGPFFYLGLLYAEVRGEISKKFRTIILGALSLVQLGSCVLAYWSGESAKILSSANEELINQHERTAQVFVGLSLALMLALALEGKSWLGRTNALIRFLCLLILFTLFGFAVELGHLGGRLIH